jgi:hypothetical protein
MRAKWPPALRTLTQQRAAEADALLRTLGDQSAETLSHLRAYERHYFFSPELGERLAADLGEYQRVLEQVRQQGSADARWQDLRKRLARIEPIAKRLQQELDRFSEGTARRSGVVRTGDGEFRRTRVLHPAAICRHAPVLAAGRHLARPFRGVCRGADPADAPAASIAEPDLAAFATRRRRDICPKVLTAC